MNPKNLFFAPLLITFSLAIGTPSSWAQQSIADVTSADVIKRISEVRRTIRLACKDLKSAQSDTVHRASLMSSALETTALGEKLWNELLSDADALKQSPYKSHPAWLDSTALISAGMVKMQELIKAGDPMSAIMACGANCGRFVRLNQAAGVYRTSDLLFQIRMTAKKLESSVAKSEFAEIRAALPGMLSLRDKALQRIEGGTGAENAKREGLKVFSSNLDAFNQAATNEDKEALSNTYRELLKSWDEVYGLLL